MKAKSFFTVLLILVAVIAITVIQRESALTNGQASLLSAQGTDEAYLQSQQTSDTSIFGIILATAVVLIAMWAKDIRKLLTLTLLVTVPFVIMACGNTPSRKAVTLPNEVAFVVILNGSNEQVAINATPAAVSPTNVPESTAEATTEVEQSEEDQLLPSDERYWKGKLRVNTQEILITTYCFQATQTSACEARDAVRVITVNTSPVKVRWVANPIIENQPINQEDAFSMQSLEPNGGSTGVYVGAEIIAHVAPEDAALYLASYGYSSTMTADNKWPARDLATVLKGESAEVQSFLQTQLSIEYGIRSAIEQNRDYTTMGKIIGDRLISYFKAKGITIDTFGLRDGNVYENPAIQKGFDSAFDRDKNLQDVEADATQQSVRNRQQLDAANAQATMTIVAANSAAEAQQKQADVVNNNENALEQQWINKWDGHLPQVTGGDSTSYMPIVLDTPAPPSQ